MSQQSIRRSRSMPVVLVCTIGAWLLAACATTAQTSGTPDLQPPGTHRIVAVLAASGVQIYVCKRDQNNQLSWAFKAPQADLYDRSGKLIVKHSAGPSWAASDGSKITGKILQQAPNASEPDSIPLLLLQATNAGDPGLLSSVRYVQRVHTHGGMAPSQPCTEEGQEGRSPYLADYVFLK